MIYRLLGDLEIGPDGRVLPLKGGHDLIVLAALLVSANRQVRQSDLMRVGWNGEPVKVPQLHKSIAAVRAMLDELGRRGDLVTHARSGYEMRVQADGDLDMLVFQRLLREAGQARASADPGREAARLRQALALWRGPEALANLPGDALRRERDELGQRRVHAAERLFDIEIAWGSQDRILGDLAAMAAAAPASRRLCEQLLIAAYRSGHAGDALSAYERHAAALQEQTGSDPDPALRDLRYAIASGNEPAIAAAEAVIARRAAVPPRLSAAGEAGDAAAGPVPRQLPPDLADLVGRGDLVAEAAWLLGREPGRRPPVLVITGPGGIGKTALAVRVAHEVSRQYPDGQLHAELRGQAGQPADPAEVVAQFLRALGRAVPDQPSERIALYRTLLAGLRVLVVLDDAVDGAQIRDLIPASPGCAVLATSRQRMPDVSGAHHVAPLEPLRHGDAVRLFLRAAAASGIDLAGELDAVEEVAGLCGGLPLALRIAAMLRVHDHPRSTAELAGRLARQGPEALTFREQSVARTIGAGLDRLDGHARRLFLGLGLLRQPTFGPWTAAALLPEDGAGPDAALSELAASNMIEVAGPGARYRFHDLTRDYAARRASGGALPAADRAAMPGRAYQALLTMARRAHAALYGGDFEVIHSDVPDWDAPPAVLAQADEAPLAWFEQERENIRAAVSHCADLGLAATCWDLAVSAHEFYTVAGYHDDWHATHSTALEACKTAGDLRGEGIVLACLGQPALVASSTGPSGLPPLQRAVRLLRQCGDRHGEAIALRTLANALRRRGRLAEPLRLFRRALAGYEASGDTVGSWQARRFIGQAYLDLGRPADARRELEGALGIAVQLGTSRLLAQTWYWVGQALLAGGDITGARARFAEMLELFAEPAGLGHAYAVHGLGDAARLDGDADQAAACLALAARLARDEADVNLEGRVALSAARLHEQAGQAGQAIDELTRAVACFISCQAAHLRVEALFRLAMLHQAAGRAADARDAWSGIEGLYAELDVPAEDRMRRRPAGLEG